MDVVMITESLRDTVAFGARLAAGLRPGDIVLLEGPLGAGKTVLVRGVVKGLDPDVASLVSSQSYVITGEYPTRPVVVHLDLYRLSLVEEVLALGYEELIYGDDRVALVEWPALLEPLLEPDDPVLRVFLEPGERPDSRRMRLVTEVPHLREAVESAITRG